MVAAGLRAPAAVDVVSRGGLREVALEVGLQLLEAAEAGVREQLGPVAVQDVEVVAAADEAQVRGRGAEPEGAVEERAVRVDLVAQQRAAHGHAPGVPEDGPEARARGEGQERAGLVARGQAVGDGEELGQRPQRARPRVPAHDHLVPPGHRLGARCPHVVELAFQVQRGRDQPGVAVRRPLEEAVAAAVHRRALVVAVLLEDEVHDDR
mmetsp:Transcript_73917/g.229274  ORF Transcript_73917/g.229274 Transcript_73917/m.229274 type:complete len:209 (+) Transcript_73917:810-1436(+)